MLIAILRANVDVFAWQPSDIPGVPREVIEHHLDVCPHVWPVKQKVRKQALERQQFIVEEIKKLRAVGLLRGLLYPTWLANLVIVARRTGKGDFVLTTLISIKLVQKILFPCRASTRC